MRYNPCTVRLFALFLVSLSVCAQSGAELRARLLPLIGGLPERRTPLNARVTGAFERPGYHVENVVFESLPGFRVTANLYVPTTGAPPYPAILGVAGHSDNGKANSTYQHAWISFARRGYVVLAYDPPGQGERLEYFDPETGRSRVGIGVNEHIAAGLQCLLTGTSIARYFIWDGIRAFDYLTTRKEVDPARVAVAGNSGGGTQAAYLAVFEPRLAAAVSSCYITSWKQLFDNPGPQDAEQVWPGFLKNGFDFVDFIKSFAPRPFLITSAIRDYFPIEGARAAYAAAAAHYKSIDAPGRVGFFEYDDTHGWSQPRREAAYRFLDSHLKGSTDSAPESPVETEPDTLLTVTPTGQLATSFGSETVFSLNRAYALEMYPRRKALRIRNPDELRALIRARLTVRPAAVSPRTAPPGTKPAVLTAGVSAADLEELHKAGFVVASADPPQFAPGRGGYTGAYQAAAREWVYGRTLLGARVAGILNAFNKLASDPQVDPSNVRLWGRGNSGVAALIAAALEPRIARVLAEQSVSSWMAVTQARYHENVAEIIVPGVLEDFDLPDLVNLIAPRPIWLAEPRMPAGGRLPPQAVFGEYPKAWVRVAERFEGWTAARAYRDWLSPSASR